MLAVRAFEQGDFAAVREIYQQGIDTGNATFQTKAKDWEEWDKSLLPDCRLVAVEAGRIVGWTALSPVSSRCVYAGVAEASVYVAANMRGSGVGYALLRRLKDLSEENGIWTLQAGIFPENRASIALFEKTGFRVIGKQEHLGKMDGVWRDVVLLERRSTKIGIQDPI